MYLSQHKECIKFVSTEQYTGDLLGNSCWHGHSWFLLSWISAILIIPLGNGGIED